MNLGRLECKANDAVTVKTIMPETIWHRYVFVSDVAPKWSNDLGLRSQKSLDTAI